MKKLFALILALATSVGVMCGTITIDGIVYVSNSVLYTAEVSRSSSGYSGDIVIPASVNYDGITYSVTSIREGAFLDCSGLTSVTIPNSITSIGSLAFGRCTGLTSITIPNSVTSIGLDAFYGCTGLISVTLNSNTIVSKNYSTSSSLKSVFGAQVKEYIIGKSITSIGNNAFYGCDSITSIEIPNSVTSIGSRAFKSCYGLTSVTIPNNVTSIGDSAFYAYRITSVTLNSNTIVSKNYTSSSSFASVFGAQVTEYIIGDGVTSIGDYAFDGCSSLTSITIPNSVTNIGVRAFGGCKGLTSVTIPDSVTSIGYGTFSGCSGLTSITIPDSVTSIGDYAFSSCNSLTSITIPNSVTSIGSYAIQYCRSLTSVTIPNSVTSIGRFAFYYCSGLTSITCEASIPPTLGNDVFSYGVNKKIPLYVPYGTINAYSAAEQWKDFSNIREISCVSGTCGDNLAWELSCDGILTISGTGSMNDYSTISPVPWYSYRSDISDIILNEGITSIGDYAFASCSGLTSITFPDSVTSIGDYAFASCSGLTSITIPNSVTNIGDYAFASCSGLTSITSEATIPPTLGSDVFTNVDKTIPLYVPNGAINTYSAAAQWKDFLNCVITSGTCGNNLAWELSCDGNLAFSGTGSMNNYITSNAPWYSYRSGISDIILNEDITSIGYSAFQSCTGLTSVTIPNSVTSIGSSAFHGCTGLASVTIPNSVTSIGYSAFHSCTGLTSVTIPYSVTSIESSVFSSCSGLTSVEIPNSVTSIGNRAFSGCSGLTSVTIPNSVTSIGGYAFYRCTGLTSLTCYATTPPTVGSNAFNGIDCSNIPLYVPAESVLLYKSANIWKTFNIKSLTPLPFYTISASAMHGVASGSGQYEMYSDIVLLVTPDEGYMFKQWSDGNTDNPRTITVTEDASYTAICVPIYTITTTAQNGTVEGAGTYEENENVQLLVTPNEGYMFKQWSDGNKDNPRTIIVTGNASYTAICVSHCTIMASATNGIVEGAGTYAYQESIQLLVIPNEGYVFKQWSDSNTDNPRTITVTEDAIFTAICEEFREPANTIHLPYNEPFTSSIGNFSIQDVNLGGVDYVWKWASANYGMKATAYTSNTSHTAESWLISPPISLVNTSNILLSFQHAVNKGVPDNLSVKISTDFGTTWSNLPISNWPAGTNWNFVSASESLDAYTNSIVQIAFVYVSTSSICPTWEVKNLSVTGTAAAEVATPLTMDVSETTASITWLEILNAATYELIIYDSSWNVICVIVFDSEGHLLNVTNYASVRSKTLQQEQSNEFAYTITGLNSGTEYNFMLVAKDNTDKMVTSYSGSFKTNDSTTALEEVNELLLHGDPTQCSKLLRDGQILILRGDKTYTITGQEVR